jgi:hypothetical protein
MTPITLVMPYYEQPVMLRLQFQVLQEHPARLKRGLHVTLVDDGSPDAPALPVLQAHPVTGLASFRLYRTDTDIRWNQHACRNMGASEASTEWLLLTDIDHLVPTETLDAVLRDRLNGTCAYTFARVSAPDWSPYQPHPNSWLLTKEAFDLTGGYDERMCGFYGGDADFRRSVARIREVVARPDVLVRVPREVVPDASTTRYTRREPQDVEAARSLKHLRKETPDYRPLRGTCTWTRLL